MNLIEQIHEGYVFGWRVRKLAENLAAIMPPDSRVLDVGCGNGQISYLIMQQRPDVRITGIDVLVREKTFIPVDAFDGHKIPYGNASYDAVMFVDVLHHTEDPLILLREAGRVARKAVIIKDHTADGFLAGPTLRFMDYIGNARHGVVLPYNYWAKQCWLDAFAQLGWHIAHWQKNLKLYPWPASWIFGRSLHFLASLEPSWSSKHA